VVQEGLAVVLTAVERGLADAWRRYCDDLPGVRVVEGSILEVECDAVVSPVNSYGFMDGGIDALYMADFGPEIQMVVRQTIWGRHAGELLVGDADIVPTGHARIPYLIAARTMRVPMRLGETVNPYLAARAVFRLLLRPSLPDGTATVDAVKTVAFPGLGTGVGPSTCAMQVRAAYEDIVLKRFTMPRSWAEASERHQLLYTTRPRRLRY
jgi:O-acetyl-ADP-ribose deacetylase (regulator of RNase III)